MCMNTAYYSTDECATAIQRVVDEASVSESRIMLKGFDVGDPMELKNSTTKCNIPRMALGVFWLGQVHMEFDSTDTPPNSTRHPDPAPARLDSTRGLL